MKKQWIRLAVVMVGWMILLLFVVNSRPVNQYIAGAKREAVHADLQLNDDEELRQQIKAWAKERTEPPINARLDRVWKAIPGYNGREVDIEASLDKMQRSGKASPEQLVYRQVNPQITLEQLGAQPIYRGNPQKPAVSFMVNVAWGNEYLESILDTLDKHQVKTTFFLDGSWVKRHPELAKKIVQRGHEIGNHAYSHPNMSRLSPEMIRQEIGKTQQIIQQVTGITPNLFAPPSGDFNERVVAIAAQQFHLKTILWTADTVDWRKPPLQTMLNRVNKGLGKGSLILMHPTEVSMQGLEQMILSAKQKGLVPTTVSQVISSQRLDTP
ncbi:polysaccharide deacetylase family protein [Brevibacillus fulvus]|uniref:Sporulation protein (Polysaccharide deacetylase family) n=1 Tax=Brevibacillus fulvus TaxID=1125967 RepID=A0A938XUY8_9BACL|nr:polysaccharide deacetylase family protein [Brevibacillus fulvus]MBM7590572.1 putative sporulation protein (polysaccharide deacetylase family) [Brevibacillus fulvus]